MEGGSDDGIHDFSPVPHFSHKSSFNSIHKPILYLVPIPVYITDIFMLIYYYINHYNNRHYCHEFYLSKSYLTYYSAIIYYAIFIM